MQKPYRNPEKIAAYLKLMQWARKRYTDKADGFIVLEIGGKLSIYSRIEKAAYNRYIR